MATPLGHPIGGSYNLLETKKISNGINCAYLKAVAAGVGGGVVVAIGHRMMMMRVGEALGAERRGGRGIAGTRSAVATGSGGRKVV